MASITKKMIHGHPYYYARECKWVDRKPKIVWQRYLGKAEDIIAAVTGDRPPSSRSKPKKALVSEFGALVALYDIARRLQLVEHIDRQVPKDGNGPTVGTYILVAALNRCTEPRSKASIGDWFNKTVLWRWVPIESRQLSSQRYWDNMDRITSEDIRAIEAELTAHMVKEFNVDLRRVLFDATNFFTFVDTFNERCCVAQRGKSKEGRTALRIVGLALLVSADFHIPLLHRTYPGNQPDAPTFSSLTEDLVARVKSISQEVEHITLIFDKGNNSKDNLEAIGEEPFHFIGSLVPTQHKELLEIPPDEFTSLEEAGLPGVRTYRTTKTVFGATRTVVVAYNENLYVAQSRTLLREVAKRQRLLAELQDRLRRRRAGEIRGGKAPTVASTRKKVHRWLKARHMKNLLQVEVTEEKDLPRLEYQFDKEAWERLQTTLLGKTIIFTDNEDWSDADIVRGYRSQHHVEAAFRTMKDPHHIALRPQYCWTDQKIEVHVFTCVLALTLCSLLRRELHQKGHTLSIPSILDTLGEISEVGVVYPPEGRSKNPRIEFTLSEMQAEQRVLYDALNLERYLTAA